MANEQHLGILRSGVEEWNSWRAANPEHEPDLSNADLHRADLSNADLGKANLLFANLDHADLLGANLRGAALRWANLHAVDLSNADLSDADLSNADLRHANLGGANLSRADLYGVNLNEAHLAYARLSDTRLWSTLFCTVDLSKTAGLEECAHHGPCSVDTHTLRISRGLPDAFLRGCGLADWEIEAARLYHATTESERSDFTYRILDLLRGQRILDLLPDQPVLDFYSVFISYSHADKEFAERLHDDLQKRGVRCWRDEHQMLPGDDIYEQIDRGVRHWDKIILLASEASLTSWWVDSEIDIAFDKERALMKERGQKTLAVIPLKLDSYFSSDKWQSGKKRQLRSRVAADFTGWKPGQPLPVDRVEQLIRALQTNEAGREEPPEQKL